MDTRFSSAHTCVFRPRLSCDILGHWFTLSWMSVLDVKRTMSNARDAPTDTLNTFMGAFFGIISGILITEYLTSIDSVLIYLCATCARIVILRSIGKGKGDTISYILNIAAFCVLSSSVYQCSISMGKPISYDDFYPITAPMVYSFRVLLLELISRRRV